jgi:pimeloyl-ACP methyl ester carboxylesterase
MGTITSNDGTRIAYDRIGAGPAVILVYGALAYRDFWGHGPLAALLADHFTVYTYDRRGRGESNDAAQESAEQEFRAPLALEREIEDLDALIKEAGGSAFLYGDSSGGALVLEAAIRLGDKVKKLAMYEAPYNDDDHGRQAWREFTKQLGELLAADRRGDAVALFMKLTGATADQIGEVRQTPMWPIFEAVGHTLAYDHIAILGEDASVPAERAASVAVPALVMNGGTSYEFMRDSAMALAKAIPNGQHRTLEGQTHEVSPEALAPVLIEFFKA